MTTKKTHDDFVLAHAKKSVSIMFDDKEMFKGSIELQKNEFIKTKLQRLLKVKKSAIYVWVGCILTLFTPFKLLFLLSVLYMAVVHLAGSSLKSYIIDGMKNSEEFYNEVLDKKLVHLEYK